MNRLTVISKNINKREINMVIVHSFADAHKEALDAMERGCDEAVIEDEVHNVILRLKKPKKTNFDRITASPEALAIFIEDIMMPCYGCNVESIKNCPHKKKSGVRFCDRKECYKWLNEECKE